MKALAWDLKQLSHRCREGSRAPQMDRHRKLQLSARQLEDELGFRRMHADSLKPKHAQALVDLWKRQPTVSDATIENRLAALRWWAEKVGKTNIIPRHNAELGIAASRVGETTSNKARTLSEVNLQRIRSLFDQSDLACRGC